ncbi:Lrp/AsnC family transcriptional regulator [Maribacter polysaccharolyticus]|uniref:Lrp/AsnC family transcriptional regulator n=1 Tax=Maribacter polysaccharolyticus TaxID=3020831 RepID=UPI00237F8550|nr:Lrp/AsnC ligand binding domain-containing protein [Maribacter polysaccharolyticus]MDE3742581.1 Lrp/AsnC ligand binding domain-containing protein [Maribacter polysaccharolyticus]
MKNKLDQVDYKIISILSDDAQMPFTEVAKKLIVSPGTIHSRVRKMREMGLITGASLKLDYANIGWKLTVFLGIYLSQSSLYKQVMDDLIGIKEVVRIHHTTGKYDIFIKMHTRDSMHYREVYQDQILSIEGIKGVESFISVEEKLSRHIEFGM